MRGRSDRIGYNIQLRYNTIIAVAHVQIIKMSQAEKIDRIMKLIELRRLIIFKGDSNSSMMKLIDRCVNDGRIIYKGNGERFPDYVREGDVIILTNAIYLPYSLIVGLFNTEDRVLGKARIPDGVTVILTFTNPHYEIFESQYKEHLGRELVINVIEDLSECTLDKPVIMNF